jgi:hypothetical protein
MARFQAGYGSLLAFQLLVAVLVYFVPLPFLNDKPGILIAPTEYALWRLFGVPIACAIAALAGVAGVLGGRIPAAGRRPALIVALLPAAIPVAGCLFLVLNDARSNARHSTFQDLLQEVKQTPPSELPALVARYQTRPQGAEAIIDAWRTLFYRGYRTDTLMSETRAAQFEQVAAGQLNKAAEADRYLWEELFIEAGSYQLHPGGLAAFLAKCKAARIPVGTNSHGGGLLNHLQPRTLFYYVGAPVHLRLEDLEAFENLVEGQAPAHAIWVNESRAFIAAEQSAATPPTR